MSLIVGALTISKIKTIKYYDLAYGEKIEITERDYKILFFKSKGKADIVKSETSKTDYSDAIKYSMLTFGSVLLTLTIINRKKG